MSKASLRLGLFAGMALSIGVAAGLLLQQPRSLEIRSGTLLRTPRPVIDFVLETSDRQAYTKADFAGHWTVIFPGFTYCPDVCPTTLATLKAVQARLGAAAGKLRVVMLSVDPARDTPEKLGAYVHAFSADFIGVTGSLAELERLGENLGYVYSKVPGATPDSYSIDHSAALILIGPDAELRGYLTPPYQLDALVADFKTLTTGRAHSA